MGWLVGGLDLEHGEDDVAAAAGGNTPRGHLCDRGLQPYPPRRATSPDTATPEPLNKVKGAPSNLAGRTLADLITGTESERVDLPWVNGRHPRWEPEPLRWLGVRGSRWILAAADSYEFRTNREARTAVALARKLRND